MILFYYKTLKGKTELEKLKLYGFNNLTKTLSFNIYDICYAETQKDKEEYVKYIDEQYNSDRLTNILCRVTDMIGAHVLNISKQDYEPQGASATILITEEAIESHVIDPSCNGGNPPRVKNDEILAHLDKSHLSVHTYPETHPDHNVSTFRVDIDVSTCGRISPLRALDFLISSFDSDIMTIDYRVRGFTRDLEGTKFFIDHDISSIQDFIDDKTLSDYEAMDVNVLQPNIFHTKMMKNHIDLDTYLFKTNAADLSPEKQQEIEDKLQKEMIEIYYGTNIY